MAEIWQKIKQHFLSQLLVMLVFLGTGVIVCCLHGALYFILRPFSVWYFRKLGYYLVCTLHQLLTFLITWWADVKTDFYIDFKSNVDKYCKENVLMLVNHHYDIDFLLTFLTADYFRALGSTKLVVKRALCMIPVLGWCWKFQEYLFLDRNWATDKNVLGNQVESLLAQNPYPVCLGMAPEGTRFTVKKHQASLEVARQKGLPELKHLLLPRTKGFVLTRQQMTEKSGFKAVYDVTYFVDPETETQSKIVNVFKGQSCKVKIFIRRFPIEDVPVETEACGKWLHKLFQEKDQLLEGCCYKMPIPKDYSYCTVIERKLSTLANFVFWAVVVLGPLTYWIIKSVLNGSYASLNWICFVFMMVRLMYGALTAAASVEKGSSYGS